MRDPGGYYGGQRAGETVIRAARPWSDGTGGATEKILTEKTLAEYRREYQEHCSRCTKSDCTNCLGPERKARLKEPIDDALALRLYGQGCSNTQVAKALGVTLGRIKYWRQQRGLTGQTGGVDMQDTSAMAARIAQLEEANRQLQLEREVARTDFARARAKADALAEENQRLNKENFWLTNRKPE